MNGITYTYLMASVSLFGAAMILSERKVSTIVLGLMMGWGLFCLLV